jgi:nitroreductase
MILARPTRRILGAAALTAFFGAMVVEAADATHLPPPRTEGGRTLTEALQLRRSTREFSAKPISQQLLSDLLWAAFGVNRPEEGGRTAPSAYDHQEIDIYVFTTTAVYRYAAKEHALETAAEGDFRALTGTADFAKAAPVSLVYVADHSKSVKARAWEVEKHAYVDTGFIGQNVYLFAASEGLGSVFHESVDRGAVAEKLGLRRDQQVTFAQAVGYPATQAE